MRYQPEKIEIEPNPWPNTRTWRLFNPDGSEHRGQISFDPTMFSKLRNGLWRACPYDPESLYGIAEVWPEDDPLVEGSELEFLGRFVWDVYMNSGVSWGYSHLNNMTLDPFDQPMVGPHVARRLMRDRKKTIPFLGERRELRSLLMNMDFHGWIQKFKLTEKGMYALGRVIENGRGD